LHGSHQGCEGHLLVNISEASSWRQDLGRKPSKRRGVSRQSAPGEGVAQVTLCRIEAHRQRPMEESLLAELVMLAARLGVLAFVNRGPWNLGFK
jgi:hypothetical protein